MHAYLRVADPNHLAEPRWFRWQDKFKLCWDSVGRLNLKTCAGFRKIAHRAWDRVAAEKNLPGFEQPRTPGFSMFVHGCHGEEAPTVSGSGLPVDMGQLPGLRRSPDVTSA
jgi:hypothetical protein